MLKGTFTALVTPMYESGAIDYESLNNLIEFQISNGVNGIVIAASTGEGMSLITSEQLDLINYCISQANSRIKIIVYINQTTTKESLNYIRLLQTIKGIDYVMVVTPPYIKPTQEGLYQYFGELAKISVHSIILYNVPSRTGCDLKDDTILRLSNDFKKIMGLKDASSNILRCSYLVKNKPDHLSLYCGDDGINLPFMLYGGQGVISVLSNILPKQVSSMINFCLENNIVEARKLHYSMLDIYDTLFLESNPIPIKWMLYAQNIIQSPYLRLPLTALSKEYQQRIKNLLDQIK